MQIGMLWFDNNPKEKLEEKVEHAVAYYMKKYGAAPNLCYVNPCMLNGKVSLQKGRKSPTKQSAEKAIKLDACNIEIRPSKAILPDHFWIGVNGGKNTSAAKQ